MHAMHFEVYGAHSFPDRLDSHRARSVTAMPHTMQGQAGCARASERLT